MDTDETITDSSDIHIATASPKELEQLSIGTVTVKPLGANQRCVSLVLLLIAMGMYVTAANGNQWVEAAGNMAAGRPLCRFGLWQTCNCIEVGQNGQELPCRRMDKRLDTMMTNDDSVFNQVTPETYITRGLAVGSAIFTAFTLVFLAWEKTDSAVKPTPLQFKRVKLITLLLFICAMLGVATTRSWDTNPKLAIEMNANPPEWTWGRDYLLWRAAWITILVATPIAQFLE